MHRRSPGCGGMLSVFLIAYGSGLLISILFPEGEPQSDIETLYIREDTQSSEIPSNCKYYCLVLALYGVGIFILLWFISA
jgi:hypothetical protein